eukprot:687497-Pleurochrysis_carterae.AAC.1
MKGVGNPYSRECRRYVDHQLDLEVWKLRPGGIDESRELSVCTHGEMSRRLTKRDAGAARR